MRWPRTGRPASASTSPATPGATLAQLATTDLDADSLTARYTFGATRVATLAFGRRIQERHCPVVHGWFDPGMKPWMRNYRPLGRDGEEAYRRDAARLCASASTCQGRTRRSDAQAAVHLRAQDWSYRARLDEISAARASL